MDEKQDLSVPPRNLRPVGLDSCVMCVAGDNPEPTVFQCKRPGGPRWTKGQETEHICDLFVSVEETIDLDLLAELPDGAYLDEDDPDDE